LIPFQFQYEEPESLDEALAALSKYGEDAKVLAGGTGLINLMKQRLVVPTYLIGLRRISELGGIAAQNGDLRIGAGVTHRALETSREARAHAPLLEQTLHHVATVRIRNSATIGGALAHADPNQDLPPALIVLDARVRTRSPRGERELAVAEIFTGYYETVLQPDELITEVIIPRQPAGTETAFLKFLPRTQDDYGTVVAAARLVLEDGKVSDARVAVGCAGATPIRAEAVEAVLKGRAYSQQLARDAAAQVGGVVDPTSDFRGSASYKRDMAVVFVRRALEQAAAGAGSTAN